MIGEFKPVKVGDVELPMKCLYYRYINGFAVPCGKCEFCRKQRAREWAFRLEQEGFDKYVYNCLLTYCDEELPYHKGAPCVSKIHVQEFLKRFRYYIEKEFGTRIKYFLCAEYGGKRHRPHYHMIVFSDLPLKIKSRDPYSKINDILLMSWKHGICDIEPLNSIGGSVNYLTSYMTTYSDGVEYDKYNKPFLMMSRSGLGKSWIDRHPQQVKKMVTDMDYTTISSGHKLPLPRYLKRKIMPEEQQIANADEFYYYSLNFRNNEQQGRKQGTERAKRIKEQREFQKQRERDDYRKVKVHANNSNTSQLSNRVKTTAKRETPT